MIADASDIFGVFARVITDGMSNGDLRARVLDLEAKNEKLHETVVKLQALQAEAARDQHATHDLLTSARDENQQLRVQLRQLQTQLATFGI